MTNQDDKEWFTEEGERQDTKPFNLEQTFQNLEHHGENENFLRAEAHKYGVDFDERQKGEPEEIINNKNENEN
jgi:hypothetical protein